MRLYLSSYRLGNAAPELMRMVGANRKACVVVNALDGIPAEGRHSVYQRERADLEQLGFDVSELDLSAYFGVESSTDTLKAALQECGLVWVAGGNAFVLRRSMLASGFGSVIADLLESDAILYGGYSAGVCALAPTLRGLETVDAPNYVPPGYSPEPLWDGLGILGYCVAPHYRSQHRESADIEKTVQYYIDHHMLFRALHDGEVIIREGNQDIVTGVCNTDPREVMAANARSSQSPGGSE